MKIATWNVNSIGVRLQHTLDWLSENPVDVLCMQEIKCVDEKFPAAALLEAGYQSVIYGQKSYNGVAIIHVRKVRKFRLVSWVMRLRGKEDFSRRRSTAFASSTRIFPMGRRLIQKNSFIKWSGSGACANIWIPSVIRIFRLSCAVISTSRWMTAMFMIR